LGQEKSPNRKIGKVTLVRQESILSRRKQGKRIMKREEKSDLVSSLQSFLKEANGVFVIENKGLTVKELEGLRGELRGLVSVFKVVKNRLMKLALKDTEFEPVSDLMKRPTAVAVATDALAVTKVLAKYADMHPNLSIIGGKMDAELLNSEDVVQLSKLPSLLEIRGAIARIVIEPASRLARVSAEYGKK
jgi:large subunit ribosomal protein L10